VARNYQKETAYENTPAQVKRREARNKRERQYEKKHKTKHVPAGKELDHQGYHVKGSLDHVPVRLVSRSANRKRQPPTKARGSARR
jgi:hypothetical protein